MLVSASLSLLVYCGLRALREEQKEQVLARLGIKVRQVSPQDLIERCRVGVGLLSSHLRRRELQVIENQLPDLIAFLTTALKASLSLRQAFEEAALELPPPLDKEIHRLVQELSMGLSLEQALENLSARVPLEDLNLLATAITIASSSGGNLIFTLETLSQTIRERLSLKREIKVLTAQGRFSGLVLSALPIGVLCFLAIFSPQDLKKFLSLPLGWLILIVGLCLNLVGFLLIQKITDIEV